MFPLPSSSHSPASAPAASPWTRLRCGLPGYMQMGLIAVVLLALGGVQGSPQQTGSSPTPDSSSPHQASLERPAPTLSPPDGKQIYQTRCLSCHQMNGRGVPGTFPPLGGTEWVNGDKGRLIRLLLNGLSGSIEVKGTTYTGVMPPWGGALNNAEVAAIATYIRTNFGNDASPVTTKEAAAVRAATKSRKEPWTAKELKKEANQGIPGDSTASNDSTASK